MPTSSAMRDQARRLRAQPTEAQTRLWSRLQPLRRSHGLAFRRQHPLGPFIVDFACLKSTLIVELDDDQRVASAAHQRRDAFFAQLGFKGLRFRNHEALQGLEDIATAILSEALARRGRGSARRSTPFGEARR